MTETETKSSSATYWREFWGTHDTDVLYSYLTDIQNELRNRASQETYRLIKVERETGFPCITLYYQFVFQGTSTGTIKTCFTPLPLNDDEIVEGWVYAIRASEKDNNITNVLSIKPVEKTITPFRSLNTRVAKEYQV